jgi:N-acetylglucosamine-6-phosphate deacetylase
MRFAAEGLLTICLNFDGEHVDHNIARRAVELVGPDRFIVMTDRCDVPRLGGQPLTQIEGSGLWYQGHGIVAAGSRPVDIQMQYLRPLGFDEPTIWDMVSFNPAGVLGSPATPDDAAESERSFVSATGQRSFVVGIPANT